MPAKILSVGQCGFDNSRLARFLGEHFEAAVDTAHSAAEARQKIQGKEYDLVLVNRVFDADGESGIDFIGQLKNPGDAAGLSGPPAMLVSNYPEAQAQAIAQGAIPGFGKGDLSDPTLVNRLRAVLEPASADAKGSRPQYDRGGSGGFGRPQGA